MKYTSLLHVSNSYGYISVQLLLVNFRYISLQLSNTVSIISEITTFTQILIYKHWLFMEKWIEKCTYNRTHFHASQRMHNHLWLPTLCCISHMFSDSNSNSINFFYIKHMKINILCIAINHWTKAPVRGSIDRTLIPYTLPQCCDGWFKKCVKKVIFTFH